MLTAGGITILIKITESEGDTQRSINEVERTRRTLRIKINKMNTMILVCEKKPQDISSRKYIILINFWIWYLLEI